MQASVTQQQDGTVLLRMDTEAARATFANVIFASGFHEGIRELEPIARRALKRPSESKAGEATCR
jgi:hypothetical protein